MTAPKRIQRKRTKGWRMPEGAVYVGRGTEWGNPWRVLTQEGWMWLEDPDGRAVRPSVRVSTAARKRKWRSELTQDAVGRFASIARTLDVHRLAGRDLACWCPLDQPCHADVLLGMANEATR